MGYVNDKRLMATVAENTKRFRETAGYQSRWGLSEAAGLAVSCIYDIERGRRLPSLRAAVKICEACGRTLDELVRP